MKEYAVIDLEMCRVPKYNRTKEYRRSQEIIQIGAVLLDAQWKVKDQFMTYVQPAYGYIDSFIENLTGITGRDVRNAPAFERALAAFLSWLPEETVIVSWSESDLYQLRGEMEMKSIRADRMEILFDSWVDCQAEFSEKIGENHACKLSEALIAADIFYEEKFHDALSDARNTALLFAKMEQEPEFCLNQYYAGARKKEVQHLSVSLGSLLAGMNFEVCGVMV